MLNNKGFTLIETVFVLFIICILMTISMNLHIPSQKQDQSIQDIIYFLYEAKLQAISSKKTVEVQFHKNMVSYSYDHIYEKLELDEDTYFDNHRLTYNAHGHIKDAKTINYHTTEKEYQFIFQVGSGTFYVQ